MVKRFLDKYKSIWLIQNKCGTWSIHFYDIETECDRCHRDHEAEHEIEFSSKWKALLFYKIYEWLRA